MLGKKHVGEVQKIFDFGWGKLLYERGLIFPVGQKISWEKCKIASHCIKNN